MPNYYTDKNPVLSGLIILLFLSLLLITTKLASQEIGCSYDSSNPSIISARTAFRTADLKCAEQELKELLALKNISRKLQADAHLLLASVYFIDEPDANVRRHKVKKELVEMYMADRRWQGQMEIVSSEFRALLNDAREIAQWRFQNSPEISEKYTSDSLITAANVKATADTVALNKQKPWYTKWWALGSGVGLVVVAVQLLGNEETTEPPPIPVDTLPDFPSTP